MQRFSNAQIGRPMSFFMISAASAVALCAVAPALAAGPPSNAELREVQRQGQRMVIATWNEPLPAGNGAGQGERHFYAVSIDGVTFTAPRSTTYQIKLRQGDFDPLRDRLPTISDRLTAKAAASNESTTEAPAASGLYIVQFIAPPTEMMLDQLRDLGALPRAYLPEHAHVVEMTATVREQVTALASVRWTSEYHAAYRLEEALVDEFSRAGQDERGHNNWRAIPTRRYSIMVFERGAAAQQAIVDRIAALGGVVNARISEGFRLEATLTAAQLVAVASMNQVQFVDQWGPAGVDMNIAREIGGAMPLLSNSGFTGQGVRGEVMDNGIRLTHLAFATPAPLVHGAATVEQSHGTSTFGIVFGNGASNASGTGLMPNREQGIFAMYTQLIGQGGSTSRYTHTQQLINPLGPFRAVFQSNSWGSGPGTTYTTVSAEMDDILFLNDILVCQSQSNNGSQLSRPEAWSKNNISVGGVTHQNTLSRTDDLWTAASYGPASDTRVKPDLTHFYDNVLCPTGGTNTSYTTTFNGTSAATPIVCGYAGLLHQMWHEGVFSGFGGGANVFLSRPRMSTAKALLINSAYKYNWLAGGSNSNLNRTKQGWGMPDLAKLYNDRAKTFIVNETDPILPFGVKSYQFQVGAGEPEFRATLVYTDPKGNPASSVALINDLNLQVVAPNGTMYWGNNGLTASNNSTPGGLPDNRNTVENVFIPNPPSGVWTVSVFGDAIVQDARLESPQVDADYALVVVGGPVVLPCPADITGDNMVNINDLLAVINGWGACPPGPAACPQDLTADGLVNASDLVVLINLWGQCP